VFARRGGTVAALAQAITYTQTTLPFGGPARHVQLPRAGLRIVLVLALVSVGVLAAARPAAADGQTQTVAFGNQVVGTPAIRWT
jgi:hypothetical protein